MGLAVALAFITASGYIRRDAAHFTYVVYGRWRRWWLALLVADLIAIAVGYLVG